MIGKIDVDFSLPFSQVPKKDFLAIFTGAESSYEDSIKKLRESTISDVYVLSKLPKSSKFYVQKLLGGMEAHYTDSPENYFPIPNGIAITLLNEL